MSKAVTSIARLITGRNTNVKLVELAREVELDMGTAPVVGNVSDIRRVA